MNSETAWRITGAPRNWRYCLGVTPPARTPRPAATTTAATLPGIAFIRSSPCRGDPCGRPTYEPRAIASADNGATTRVAPTAPQLRHESTDISFTIRLAEASDPAFITPSLTRYTGIHGNAPHIAPQHCR